MNSDRERLLNEISGLDFSVEQIGKPDVNSKFPGKDFVTPGERVSYFSDVEILARIREEGRAVPSFSKAGPRQKIFHDPSRTRAAIVTCGGLCPGLNDVVRGLVNTLYFSYNVRTVFGIRYGYRGLVPGYRLDPIPLDPETVDTIHENGGSILGSSRGPQSTEEILNTLERLDINILFTVGGDGTQRGGRDIALAARKRRLEVSVVGVPKTIDNDLNFMERTFGFETAVYAAAEVIGAAHNEAKGAYNGIGLVKLMGRDSGFIAAYASLANSVVNFCLIPEVHFTLEEKNALLPTLRERLRRKHHAVIAVAEGAGQNLFDEKNKRYDASGNRIQGDIGILLKERIGNYLENDGIDHSIKYFDPSYLIRSVAAHGTDAVFCLHLAQNAVHGAMAGLTNIVVGYWHRNFTYVPIALATRGRRKIDPGGQLWQSVLDTTGQKIS